MTQTDYSQRVLDAVADDYGMTTDELLRADRRLARPRWVAMVALHRLGLSAPKIGALLHRDHTTVLHGLRRVADSPSLIAEAQEVIHRIEAGRETAAMQALPVDPPQSPAPTTTEEDPVVVEVEIGGRTVRVEVR